MGRGVARWGLIGFPLMFLSSLPAWAQKLEMPFSFEENRGQDSSGARFIAEATGYRTEMHPDQVVIRGAGHPLRMRFVNSRDNPEIRPLDRMIAQTDVYDSQSGLFHKQLPNYQRLLYSQVYPGIDVLFRSSQRSIEFDFLMKPRAHYKSAALEFSGQTNLKISEDGSLVLQMEKGEMRLLPPSVYQETKAGRKHVSARYVKIDAARIGFELDSYDSNEALVIDPLLVFASYVGGSGKETARQVVMGPNGDSYVLYNVHREGDYSGEHIWIVRYNSSGQPVYYYRTEYPYNETGYGMAVDGQGNVALVASLSRLGAFVWQPSSNAVQTQPGGGADVQLIKFGPNGFATYLGGNGNDYGEAIAFDTQGNIYVTGSTTSTNFPTRNPYQSSLAGGSDAFLTKLDPTGSQILYSTYLGGSGTDVAKALALDSFGNIYLAGATGSNNFPTANALQSSFGGGTCTDQYTQTTMPCNDMFVTKMNPAGTALIYSTFLGGNSDDSASQLAVTPDGYVFLQGAGGLNFPATSRVFTVGSVVLKLDKTGSRFIYSMRFPSAGIATDDTGNLYVTGYALPSTTSYTFPLLNSFKASPVGQDISVAKFDATGVLLYSTLIGGNKYFNQADAPGNDWGEVIAVDREGRVFVVGETSSSDFPVTNGTTLSGYNVTSDHDSVVLVLAQTSGADTSPRFSRVEENYPLVKYTGTWNSNSSPNNRHTGGAAALAMDPGSKFTFNFTGNEIHWFGCKDEWAGIAKVFLDGAQLPDVDTYQTPGACNTEMWSKRGLGGGTHTLTVEVAGRRNPASAANWIWLDRLEIVSAGDASFDAPVAPPPPPPPPSGGETWTRFEQNNSAVAYTGNWNTINNGVLSGGSAVQAFGPNERATFTFNGTAARWIGYKDAWSGIAKVYVDGVLQTSVDTYSPTDQKQVILYTTPTLSSGTHTLAIEATATRNAAASSRWVWVDAFETTGRGSDTPPPPPPPQPPPSGGSLTRVEQNGGGVATIGSWYTINSGMFSGGSAFQAIDAGSRTTFTFTGTAARWIGYKDAWSGIAKVYVDGILQTSIDTYSAADQKQAVLYTTPTLSSGTHTLSIEATGTRSPSASSSWIWVDAFEFSSSGSGSGTPPPPPPPPPPSPPSSGGTYTRVEQNASAVTSAGSWYNINGGTFSGGSAKQAFDAGAQAIFTFTGTAAKWIGYKDPWSGIAKLYVDGVLQATVDTYSPTDQKQVVLYSVTGLSSGTHTLTIEATGTRNASASSRWVWVDAFEYAP